jgi:hypothetical protein
VALKDVYQLKVKLLDTEPPVWRRLRVRGTVTFAKLHAVLQDVMGWDDKHLYHFQIGERAFEAPDPEASGENARRHRLGSLDLAAGHKFLYVYDPGDDWHHEVTVEGLSAPLPNEDSPVCIDGENACPPEDCSGPPGYAEIQLALECPDDPAFRERLEWLEAGFRPETFEVRATNRILRLAHRRKGAV